MDKQVYWGILILVVSSSVVVWAIEKIRDILWKPKHYELYKEFKKTHDINFEEATRIFPIRKNMSDKEIEEIRDKQNEYTFSINDIWYKHIQKKNKLTDKQVEELKTEFNTGIMRGK